MIIQLNTFQNGKQIDEQTNKSDGKSSRPTIERDRKDAKNVVYFLHSN